MYPLGLEKEKPPDYIPAAIENAAPILTQPTAYISVPNAPDVGLVGPTDWMTVPYGVSDCPPGLEYLTTINQLLIQQNGILKTITGFDTKNKTYTIKNCLGQKVYQALEDSNWFSRLGSTARPFEMKIISNFGQEVIHLHRPLNCQECICPFWLQKMMVYSPPGIKIGSIEQECTFLKPRYSVKNSAGDTVLRIEGPTFRFSLVIEFNVYSKDDNTTAIGKITKQRSGLAREVLTDADYSGISFPTDLDVRIKAVLLGACFLIDYMLFEE